MRSKSRYHSHYCLNLNLESVMYVERFVFTPHAPVNDMYVVFQNHLSEKQFRENLKLGRQEFYSLPVWKRRQILCSGRLLYCPVIDTWFRECTCSRFIKKHIVVRWWYIWLRQWDNLIRFLSTNVINAGSYNRKEVTGVKQSILAYSVFTNYQ